MHHILHTNVQRHMRDNRVYMGQYINLSTYFEYDGLYLEVVWKLCVFLGRLELCINEGRQTIKSISGNSKEMCTTRTLFYLTEHCRMPCVWQKNTWIFVNNFVAIKITVCLARWCLKGQEKIKVYNFKKNNIAKFVPQPHKKSSFCRTARAVRITVHNC